MCLPVVERARLHVGDRCLVKYPSDPRHWHERRVLATPDVEEVAQAARSGKVAVLTPDWDNPMSENEGPLNDGLTVVGPSGWAATGSRSTART